MRLTRSNSDKWVAGVAGGIAEATGLDSTLVRIALAILCVAAGSGLVIYCLLWAIMPRPEGGSLAEDGLREIRAWYRNRENRS